MDTPEGWEERDAALVRELEFPSFAESIEFVVRVATLAEHENHHPDVDIRYRRVTVRWATHSAGRVTDRDRALASLTSVLV